jgi:hypothetical protein
VRSLSPAGGVWRSLATHMLWEHEIVGSNPTTPTTRSAETVRAIPASRVTPREWFWQKPEGVDGWAYLEG